MQPQAILAIILASALSFALGTSMHANVAPRPTDDTFRMEMRLGSNLYMQTAAEYRACCLTVFESAKRRLDAIDAGKLKNAAVVLDLDETVLDNQAFESYLHRQSLEYTDDRWFVYESQFPGETRLVPGAKAFIDHAKQLGVTPVFISNRNVKYAEATAKAMRDLGIDPEPVADRLWLKDKLSDKTDRREAVAKKFRVVMWVGDNLRDFAEQDFLAGKGDPAQAIAARNAAVDRAGPHWGDDWFVLPNPAYGEWDKLIATDPYGKLRPTAMK